MTCWTVAAAYLGLLFAFVLYRAWFPERCPRCRVRGFGVAVVGYYSCRDRWRCRGGRYHVRHCPHCGLYRLRHPRGEEDLPPEGWREEAHLRVFGWPLPNGGPGQV